MSGVFDFIFGPGDDAADAAKDAAEVQAQWQNRALDYLQETEEVPQALRQEALTTLGGLYGLGGPGSPLSGTGGTGTDGAYGPAPAPGQAPEGLMDEYIRLQKELAETQWSNSMMSEKLRDNQGEKSTYHLERRLDEIRRENPTVVFPPAPSLDPRYGSRSIGTPIWEQIDYSKYYGQLPDEQAAAGGGAAGGGAGGAVDPVTGEPISDEWNPYGKMEEFITRAQMSPLYQSIMGGQELGEEAIMRNAAATGGLRSGNVQGNMYDYITQLQNQALLSSYNEQLQGLSGMAGLQTNQNAIAQQMGNIGQTYAQGQTAAATAQNQGVTNWLNTGLGIGGLIMASDIRLKKNIKKIGKVNEFNFYSFDWNSIANKLGLTGSTCGCMAHEVYDVMPEAIVLRNDFMWINYSMIGVF